MSLRYFVYSLLLSALSTSVSWAEEREELLKAFNELKQNSVKRLRNAAQYQLLGPDGALVSQPLLAETFHKEIDPVKTPFGESRNIVKVWAKLTKNKENVSLEDWIKSANDALRTAKEYGTGSIGID